MKAGGQRHTLAALVPGNRPLTHCQEDYIGPTDAENLTPPGLDPRTVQALKARYTDYVIPAHTLFRAKINPRDI